MVDQPPWSTLRPCRDGPGCAGHVDARPSIPAATERTGAAGIEPAVPVLETGGLPLTDAPMPGRQPRTRTPDAAPCGTPPAAILLRLAVRGMAPAPPAVTPQLQTVRHVLLVLARMIIASLALRAGQRRLVLGHHRSDSRYQHQPVLSLISDIAFPHRYNKPPPDPGDGLDTPT